MISLEPLTGISSETILKHSDISEEELLDLIDKLNSDHRVDGLLVQLPLPGKVKVGQREKRHCICWFTSCTLRISHLHSTIFFSCVNTGSYCHMFCIYIWCLVMRKLQVLVWLLFILWAIGVRPNPWVGSLVWSQWDISLLEGAGAGAEDSDKVIHLISNVLW